MEPTEQPTRLSHATGAGIEAILPHRHWTYAHSRELDPDESNLDLEQQHWIRYRAERNLRVPDHARKGLDVAYWEADPQKPILVPRRSDFVSHERFVHAARDFNLALHRLQMQADERRREHHPNYKTFFRAGLKRAAKAAKGLELGLSMGGYAIPAYISGLW